MPTCFIVQPIHPDGIVALQRGGITVRHATASDMATVVRELGDAAAVITRDAGLTAAAIDAAPGLKVIASHGAGTNKIDVAHAKSKGITVVNTPGSNARSVAEHAMGLMLAVVRRTVEADRAVRSGQWAFRYAGGMSELHGKTLGLVGFGAIAQLLAGMARDGFGMRVVAWSPSVAAEAFAAAGVAMAATLQELLGVSDVVSLHRPLRPDTYRTIDGRALAALRPGAVLVNTGRGELIDEDALCGALQSGHLRGAGLDVLTVEPPPKDAPLLQLSNVVLSPHMGGATEDALQQTALQCAMQVIDILAGQPPRHPV